MLRARHLLPARKKQLWLTPSKEIVDITHINIALTITPEHLHRLRDDRATR